jgi:predicted DNA-binding ribbon-helix-helix protein
MNMSVIARVQTGVRLEKRLLKVLKALADYHDITLSDLLEGIVLHG